MEAKAQLRDKRSTGLPPPLVTMWRRKRRALARAAMKASRCARRPAPVRARTRQAPAGARACTHTHIQSFEFVYIFSVYDAPGRLFSTSCMPIAFAG